MKYLFFIYYVSIFVSINCALSQTFLPFITTDNLEQVLNGGVINENRFYLFNNYNASSDSFVEPTFINYGTVLPSINYRFNSLQVLDYDLDTIHSLDLTSSIDTIKVYRNSYFDTVKNEIVLIGHRLTTDSTKTIITHYDIELNKTKDLVLNLPSDSLLSLSSSYFRYITMNSKRNYLLDNMEIDSTGHIVYEAENFTIDEYTTEVENNVYLDFSGDIIITYNENFEQTSFYQFTSPDLMNSSFSVENKVLYFKESGNLYATGFIDRNWTAKNYEIIVKYNFNNNLEELVYEEIPELGINDNLRIPSSFGFDAISEDHLYLTNSYNFCGIIGSTIAPEPCDSAFVTLTHLNADGTVYWRKIIGGDAAYASLGLIPTADFGVILFVLRRSYDDNFDNEYDTYYLKLDQFGNQVDTTTSLNPNQIPIYDVLVFPNPASDFLQFHHFLTNPNLTIEVYDINGRLCLNKSIQSNKIAISKLPIGNYSYVLKNENKFLQIGKFVKN